MRYKIIAYENKEPIHCIRYEIKDGGVYFWTETTRIDEAKNQLIGENVVGWVPIEKVIIILPL